MDVIKNPSADVTSNYANDREDCGDRKVCCEGWVEIKNRKQELSNYKGDYETGGCVNHGLEKRMSSTLHLIILLHLRYFLAPHGFPCWF